MLGPSQGAVSFKVQEQGLFGELTGATLKIPTNREEVYRLKLLHLASVHSKLDID